MPVSYTHLDVYKRQGYDALIGATSEGELWVVQALHEASVDEYIYIV